MELINDIRNFLLMLTAIGAVFGVYLNYTRNFYIELVKINFRNTPIKNSGFKLIVNWGLGGILTIDFIYIIIIVYNLLVGNTKINIGSTTYFTNITTFVIWLVMFLFMVNLLSIIHIYYKIEKMLIDKIITNKSKKVKRYIKNMNIFTLVLTIMVSVILVFSIVSNLLSFEGDYKILIDSISLFLIVFTAFIFSMGLREFIKAIEDNHIYMLIGSSKYTCSCYIEYDEFYLLYENGIEKYIKKTDIKEIIKVKNT